MTEYITTTRVRKNSGGSDVGTQRRLNFIEGTNVTLAIVNDPTNGEIDIQITTAGGGDMLKAVYDPNDEGEIRLTPKATSTGAEGTMFYDSDDDHVWVATE